MDAAELDSASLLGLGSNRATTDDSLPLLPLSLSSPLCTSSTWSILGLLLKHGRVLVSTPTYKLQLAIRRRSATLRTTKPRTKAPAACFTWFSRDAIPCLSMQTASQTYGHYPISAAVKQPQERYMTMSGRPNARQCTIRKHGRGPGSACSSLAAFGIERSRLGRL